MKYGAPERGDILHLTLDPALGREQQGKRYVLVLSPLEFNRFGVALVCPITSGGTFAREHGFAVPIAGTAGSVEGVVLCHQCRTLDYKVRGAKWVEKLSASVLDEVLARVRTLVD